MSKNSIDLYKIGTKVKLTDDVYGTIIGINIRGDNYISYDCSWWNGRTYDSRTFNPNEIEVTLSEKTRIGFV